MNQNILFEDIFDIRVLNESGKKFERGSHKIAYADELMNSSYYMNNPLHSKPSALQGRIL